MGSATPLWCPYTPKIISPHVLHRLLFLFSRLTTSSHQVPWRSVFRVPGRVSSAQQGTGAFACAVWDEKGNCAVCSCTELEAVMFILLRSREEQEWAVEMLCNIDWLEQIDEWGFNVRQFVSDCFIHRYNNPKIPTGPQNLPPQSVNASFSVF